MAVTQSNIQHDSITYSISVWSSANGIRHPWNNKVNNDATALDTARGRQPAQNDLLESNQVCNILPHRDRVIVLILLCSSFTTV